MNTPARGSLLGIEHLETKEILGLLKLARRMNPQKPRPLLRGKRILITGGRHWARQCCGRAVS